MAIRKEKKKSAKANNNDEGVGEDERSCLPRARKERSFEKFVVQENPKMVRTEAEKMRALYLKNDLKPSRKQGKKIVKKKRKFR